jgi:hypothetical protein
MSVSYIPNALPSDVRVIANHSHRVNSEVLRNLVANWRLNFLASVKVSQYCRTAGTLAPFEISGVLSNRQKHYFVGHHRSRTYLAAVRR